MTVVSDAPVTVPVVVYRRPSEFMIILQALGSLALRFALALPFFKSGLTRWEGFGKLRDATYYFYQELYKPTLFGKTYAIPYPDIAALVASTAEIVLPAALVIGFATRLSALGLLIMTGVIYTTYQSLGVNPWQTETLPWAAMALALIAYGPGRLSFDWLIWQGFRRR
jgi:putative oxidoreductase